MGREPQGSVVPGRDYDDVRAAIGRGLETLVDPETGEKPVLRVYRREEIYSGFDPRVVPDLRAANTAHYRIGWQTALGEVPPKIFEDNLKAWSGDHCSNDPSLVPGVLFSNVSLARGGGGPGSRGAGGDPGRDAPPRGAPPGRGVAAAEGPSGYPGSQGAPGAERERGRFGPRRDRGARPPDGAPAAGIRIAARRGPSHLRARAGRAPRSGDRRGAAPGDRDRPPELPARDIQDRSGPLPASRQRGVLARAGGRGVQGDRGDESRRSGPRGDLPRRPRAAGCRPRRTEDAGRPTEGPGGRIGGEDARAARGARAERGRADRPAARTGVAKGAPPGARPGRERRARPPRSPGASGLHRAGAVPGLRAPARAAAVARPGSVRRSVRERSSPQIQHRGPASRCRHRRVPGPGRARRVRRARRLQRLVQGVRSDGRDRSWRFLPVDLRSCGRAPGLGRGGRVDGRPDRPVRSERVVRGARAVFRDPARRQARGSGPVAERSARRSGPAQGTPAAREPGNPQDSLRSGGEMKITTDRKLMLVLSTALILFTISGAMIGRVVAVEGTYSYLKLFNEALYLIVHNYVKPVQIDVLMEGAYRGMLESLDPG